MIEYKDPGVFIIEDINAQLSSTSPPLATSMGAHVGDLVATYIGDTVKRPLKDIIESFSMWIPIREGHSSVTHFSIDGIPLEAYVIDGPFAVTMTEECGYAGLHGDQEWEVLHES